MKSVFREIVFLLFLASILQNPEMMMISSGKLGPCGGGVRVTRDQRKGKRPELNGDRRAECDRKGPGFRFFPLVFHSFDFPCFSNFFVDFILIF